MQLGLAALPAILISAQVNVAPDVVDARGAQDVVIKVPATGMYRLHVDSEAGTACSVADHLRGPFASAGVAGRESCDLDLMLDASLYKARLSSPQRGKGKAKVTVTPFEEVQPAVRLEDGASIQTELHPHQQVSAWLHIDKRRSITLEVAGRTAGRVALWRDGRWLESPADNVRESTPREGRSIYRHRIDAVVDPGDVKVVVYGTAPKAWTRGPEDDVVFITRGAPPGGAAHARAFTLPAWGFLEVQAGERGLAAFTELDRPSAAPFSMHVEAVTKGTGARARGGPSCSIDPKAGVAACALTTRGTSPSAGNVIVLEGAPGTSGELAWGPLASTTNDGYWPTGATRDLTIGLPGRYFVTAPSFPLSMDAEPLGCAIDQIDDRERFVRRVAVDAPEVDWTEPFERSFNYAATSTAVWLKIDKPGLYTVRGDDKTKASCEVFRLDGWKKERVGAGEDNKCDFTRALGAGLYEVRFYGGRPGIQTLRVGQVGLPDLKAHKTPAKAACSFPAIDLARGRYRLVTSSEGGASLRAFLARGAPMSLAGSLPVVLDPLRTVSVTVAAGAPVVVHTQAGRTMRCRLGDTDLPVRDGVCRSPALPAPATLTLASGDDMPFLALLGRLTPPPTVPLPRFDPQLARLPTITAAAPLWMDFDRDQSRSMIVKVDRPGLYDLQTEGLLATRCRLRTPTVADLVDGDRNGRGRNCLVQGYLKPGSYLFTATTVGTSRGRAGVHLVERRPRALGAVAVGDDVFFRVAAGELAQQTFDVKGTSALALSTSAQGAALACRLDDHDGWPVQPVPASCSQTVSLEPGRYILTAMPLTVESRRRTSVTPVVPAVVLTGDRVHRIALNRRYAAELGADGKDELRFQVPVELDVGIELDHGMQGRVFRLGARGSREVIDTVPPVGTASGSAADEGDEGGAYEGDEGGDVEGDEGSETEGDEGDEGDEGEMEGGDAYGENDGAGSIGTGRGGRFSAVPRAMFRGRGASPRAPGLAAQEMPPLAGHVAHLAPGTYVLETEHSHGDVAIHYTVKIGVRTAVPGVALTAPVPGRIDVVMPDVARSGDDIDGAGVAAARAGLLRIKTRGDVDVRCRLRAADGSLVAESADSGADWNCALAVPLAPGKYTLGVEAEALQPGSTEVRAAFLEAKDVGELKDGESFRVVEKVATAPLPDAGPGVVQQVTMTSEQDFSCAAQDRAGALLDKHVGVRRCRFLLWPGDEHKGFRVFAWTADRPAAVKVALERLDVRRGGGGKIAAGAALRATLPRRGRYGTGPDSWCRQASAGGGALRPCRTAASFTPGDVVVVAPGGGRVSLDEQVAKLGAPRDELRALDGARAAERQASNKAALHLVQVEVPFGSPAAPSCAIDGGAGAHDAATCAAATGPVEESTLSVWTSPGSHVDAVIARRAASWPTSEAPLAAGASTLSFAGESARFALPAAGFRVKLALPADAWAVSVDGAGRARDLCAPHRAPVADKPGALATCVLRGRGGSLVLVRGAGDASPFEARADLLVLDGAEPPRALVGLREVKPPFPGRARLLLAAAPVDRVVHVEGWGALACSIHMDGGGHVAGCHARLPAGQGAEIKVEHDKRAWRVFTYAAPRASSRAPHGAAPHEEDVAAAAGDFWAGRFGALPPVSSSSSLRAAPLGTAVALAGHVVDRKIVLTETRVVHVHATGGVCALVEGGKIVQSQGLGGGCDLVRVLPRGTHRVVVRAFGGAPLSGNVHVESEPVVALKDGVGPEALVASGDARTFRFTLQADGEVGIGLQTGADTLVCTLLDDGQSVVGDGCHQFHRLRRGTYYLRVEAPDDEAPRRFKPVVLGLKGDVIDVPDAWLKDFFRRAGIKPEKTSEVRP